LGIVQREIVFGVDDGARFRRRLVDPQLRVERRA
jgi:hypothetical protein